MITDQEIAAALSGAADTSDRSVYLRLGVSAQRVARVRAELRMAPFRRGPRPRFASWAELYAAYAVPLADGHVGWAGRRTGRSEPVMRLRHRTETAGRYAFRTQHGREPVGNARRTCGMPGCVAGAHLADRRMREGW
ncbi:hypothetical protein SM8_031950 [Streptomyces sp. SM8]|nr:hypothetical protein SM8_031950 [Streptomyces sp. SM8]